MKPTSGCHIGQGSLVAIPASGMREKVELVSMFVCFLYVYLPAHFQVWEKWIIIFN